MLAGIALDKELGAEELRTLRHWMLINSRVLRQEEFTPIVEHLEKVVGAGMLKKELMEKLLAGCQELTAGALVQVGSAMADFRRLKALLNGMLSDGTVSREELQGLDQWLGTRPTLKGMWAFEELFLLVRRVLKRGAIGEGDQNLLESLFLDACLIPDEAAEGGGEPEAEDLVDPEAILTTPAPIPVTGRHFGFAGVPSRGSRGRFAGTVRVRGGYFEPDVSPKLDFMVVGVERRETWAFRVFRRKVAQAAHRRQQGFPLQLIAEEHFWAEMAREG